MAFRQIVHFHCFLRACFIFIHRLHINLVIKVVQMSGLSKRSLLNLTPNCQQSDHHKNRSARPHTHTHTSENQPVQTVGNRANEGTPYYQSAVLSACVLYTLVFLLPLFQPPSPFLSSVFLYSFSLNLPPSLSLLYVSDSFPSSSADEKRQIILSPDFFLLFCLISFFVSLFSAAPSIALSPFPSLRCDLCGESLSRQPIIPNNEGEGGRRGQMEH